jgi:hypothetical protein
VAMGPEAPPNGAEHLRGPAPATAHSAFLDWNLCPLKVGLPSSGAMTPRDGTSVHL